MTGPVSILSARSPFAWLRERDIDLLLCSELHAGSSATRLLADRAGDAAADFVGAWVSHAEADGESDLVVAYRGGAGQMLALVENKIAAGFQPDQAMRYAARARRWAVEEEVSKVVTILLAPAEYMSRPGSEAFDMQITYEEVADVLRKESDPRSVFLADALLAGIASYRAGYTMRPDVSVTDMWMACWEVGRRVAPALRFHQPGMKPGRSVWFYFRDADGFLPEDRKRAVLVLKADRGYADLQFSGTGSAELLARTGAFLDPDMKVVPAGKSASIRIEVMSIDFNGSPLGQQAAMEQGFEACERLRTWFVRHRTRF